MPTGRLILHADAPREQWLETRRGGIGGSDAAALLNRSPYTTPVGVYLSKLGRDRNIMGDDPLEDPIFWGNALEDAVARAWSEVAGIPVWKTGTYEHHDRPWQRANPDRLCADGVGLEVKTAGFAQRHHWDPEMVPGGVPFHYLCQVMHYMAVTGLPSFWVICLIAGQKLVVRRVDADEEDMACLTRIEERFWHEHVQARCPPLVQAADAENMTALYPRPRPEAKVELPEHVVPKLARHKHLKTQLSRLEKEAKELEVAIKDAIGDAVYGTVEGRKVVSWKPSSRVNRDGDPVRTLRNTFKETA